MGEFKNIALMIDKTINEYKQIKQNKIKVLEKINYQIQKLYDQLQLPKYKYIVMMIKKILSVYHKDKHNTNPNLQELGQYLGVKIYQLNNIYQLTSIQDIHITQLKQIIKKQLNIVQKLCEQLSKINIIDLFNEIDFFNNGYIDSFNLNEFMKHYLECQSFINIQQLDWLIKLIKSSPSAYKLYIQDLQDFIKNKIQFYIDDMQTQNDKFSVSLQKIHNDKIKLKCRQNQENILKQIQDKAFYKLSNKSIIQTSQDLNIEERLIRYNSRNKKYLKIIKESKNTVQLHIGTLNKVSSSIILNNLSENYKSEIIFYLRKISQLYQLRYQQINNLIYLNEQFNFLNGFNVIDFEQNQFINEDDFYDFLVDCKIQPSQLKWKQFFSCFSKDGFMKYSNYLKIFKIKSSEQIFLKCKERQPTFNNKWDDQLRYAYSNFIKNTIEIISNLQQNKKSLKRILISIENNNKQYWIDDEYLTRDEVRMMIGKKSYCLLQEIFEYDTRLRNIQIIRKVCDIK